jgi:hypothetical protein
MGALTLMPERVSPQGKRPVRRLTLGELLTRLVDNGTAWFHAELGLMRVDTGVLVRRILTGIALAIIAFALLTTSLVVLSGALIASLALYLGDEMLAGLIVAAGLFSGAFLASLISLSVLTKPWPAASSAFKTILDRTPIKADGDE